MAVNSFFHTSNVASIATEKSLYSDLIAEAIQIYGHDVYYLDRTLVAEDTVLGEDNLAKFTTQHPIEMYIEDSEGGFTGDKELMSQFGLQNLSEITFVVNKLRFQDLDRQMQIESGTDTSSSGSILLEAGTIDQSSSSTTLTTVTGDNNFYIIQDTAATDADRPQEGDVVYHPILDRLFEINFVDHDEPFYQLDNNPVYNLTVDALGYQLTLEQSSAVNEDIRLEFGVADTAGLLLEETDGDNIIGENDSTSVGESILLENPADSGDSGYLIQEDYIVGDFSTDKTSQNELFEVQSRSVLDFTESNPFGDVGSET